MKVFRISGRVLAPRTAAGGFWRRQAAAAAPPRLRAAEIGGDSLIPPVETLAPVLPAQVSVPVPWRVVQRAANGVLEIEQRGTAPLRAVRVTLAGGGLLGVSLPRTVCPGERVRVVLRGVSADGAIMAPDALLVLRWFQSDGTELLWPISL